jgi:hypothetical protein
MPEPVRTVELHVDEPHARLPDRDLGQPGDREPVQRQPILDQGAGAHPDRARCEDREAQPGRRDRLEVAGVREEAEHLAGRAGQRLLAGQGVMAEHSYHGRQRLPKRLDDAEGPLPKAGI